MLGISMKYTYNVICHERVHICTHMNIYIGVDGMRMHSSLYADAFPLAHPFLLGRLLFAANCKYMGETKKAWSQKRNHGHHMGLNK